MAELDKGTASSNKAKEKMSELDDDISKSFLGSWNTCLGSDDSSMDFKFEPATKGKKKEFNFDKLDMDFSLDGDFGKIKSFKVDMGDLDFSSPPKTNTKSKDTDLDFSSPPKEGTKFKESLEGESARSSRGKQDCFAFSFDFNELDKFDLDAVLPTKTKALNKDDGKRGAEINSVDKHEHNGSEIQLADTDSRDADVLKAKSMLVKTSNSKENPVPCKGILNLPPETDPSKSSTLQDQMGSKQSETSSGREKNDQQKVEEKTCNESYEEPQLQNKSAQNVHDQTQSKPALRSSTGEITDHAQGTDKQSDQVAKSCKHSYEKPKVHNQSAWSFMDKITAPDVSEQMETTSADNKSGDADSKMQALNAKVDPPLDSENEHFPVKEMMPQYDSIHLKNLPEAESESTDGQKIVHKSCNILQGDMDRATVAENVLLVVESSVELSKLGDHVAESISGRQKEPMAVASSNLSRFNLKPAMKNKAPAATQALPTRLNLVSLSRNAVSSLHPSPSGASISYGHGAHSARSRSNFDKNSASFTRETVVSENNMKIVSNQSVREHCNAMGAQMKDNLGVISVVNDGKAADRGTLFEKKKEDTKPSSFQVQSSLLPAWTSKSDNQGSEKLKPKIPSLQSVRKMKMDTIVGKLSTLKVSKKMPSFSGLRISRLSSPASEDKIATAQNLDNNGVNVTTKTLQLVGLGKQQSPAPSIKRKISEASDADPVMLHPSRRVSAYESRNSKGDLEGVAQEEVTHQTSLKTVGLHKNILDCSLKSDSYKQPESTLEIPHIMKFAEVGVTPLMMENDETIEKADVCGKELDQICSMLRKKQEEAKELLVRILVTNNKLLLLSDPMHAQKLCQIQNLASRLISRELPSRTIDPALQ